MSNSKSILCLPDSLTYEYLGCLLEALSKNLDEIPQLSLYPDIVSRIDPENVL